MATRIGGIAPPSCFTEGAQSRENDQTGLYFYRARYYDPTTGRFVSEDPIRFNAGVNFYSYVHNNPLGFRDPSGKDASFPADLLPPASKCGKKCDGPDLRLYLCVAGCAYASTAYRGMEGLGHCALMWNTDARNRCYFMARVYAAEMNGECVASCLNGWARRSGCDVRFEYE